MYKVSHPFHIVNNSPWPFFISIFLIDFVISLILIIYNKTYHNLLFQWSVISIIISVFYWVKEIFYEGVYKGEHTKKVINNLYMGLFYFYYQKS